MNPPTHDEIARQAQQLWQEQGCPGGHDTKIWLDAERQLTGGRKAAAFSERAQAETAAESVVEYNISPAVPEQEAIKAAMVKPAARKPPAKRS